MKITITMQTAQQRHILEVDDSDKPLFGSGVEKTIPYLLSDTYTFKAKKNGKVTKIDTTNNVALLEYEDGTKDIINLNSKINKNSNGGFYLDSRLEMLLNEGDTFSKGEILAKDGMYMLGNTKDDISYSMGTLAKVAIAGSDATYEDSSFISSKLSKRMKSKLTMKKEMILGTNANIDYIVKKGQEVKTGDPLITFENAFEDASINDFLEKLGTEFEETIASMTKNTYRSKYTGRVVDVRFYYNKDLEEFSPSIQKILTQYINKNAKLKKLLMENSNKDSLNQINLPPTDKIDSPKIKGKVVDGLLIEFYVEYDDFVSVGDKIAYYGSCKTIVSDVLEPENMAFYINEKGERETLDAVFSPLSLVSRMTTDISKALYVNKVILALKERVRDIMES